VVRVAVVGYVEWTEYVTLDDVPRPGWRLRSRGVLEAPGASASVVAVQLAKLGARAELFTTLAKDPNAERMARFFAEQGVEVHAAERPGIQPRSLALLDLGANERSLIAFDRANEPALADRLPWERLDYADSIVFTGGDRPLLERVRAATELLNVHAWPRKCSSKPAWRRSSSWEAAGTTRRRVACDEPGGRRGSSSRRRPRPAAVSSLATQPVAPGVR